MSQPDRDCRTELLNEIASGVRALRAESARTRARCEGVEHALQCLAFALGRQGTMDPQSFRDDFLATAELLWPNAQDVPAFVRAMLQQYTAGELQRKAGIS
jgi:hypothetical protein